MTVYSWVRIRTQARQLRGKCTHLSAIPAAHRKMLSCINTRLINCGGPQTPTATELLIDRAITTRESTGSNTSRTSFFIRSLSQMYPGISSGKYCDYVLTIDRKLWSFDVLSRISHPVVLPNSKLDGRSFLHPSSLSSVEPTPHVCVSFPPTPVSQGCCPWSTPRAFPLVVCRCHHHHNTHTIPFYHSNV